MSYLLTQEQILKGKQLFEEYRATWLVAPATKGFMDWCDEYFLQLVARAVGEPMAHQLADADQALTELEADMRRFPPELAHQPLSVHVARLRRAIDGQDYRPRKPVMIDTLGPQHQGRVWRSAVDIWAHYVWEDGQWVVYPLDPRRSPECTNKTPASGQVDGVLRRKTGFLEVP